MKELLVSFLACLVIGAIINGISATPPVPSPAPEASQPAAEQTQTSDGAVGGVSSSGGSSASGLGSGDAGSAGGAGSAGANIALKAPETGDASFDRDVLKSSVPVLVDFNASWCAPCQTMAPIVDKLATDYHGKVKVFKVDTDNNPQLSEKYQVNALPTFMVFRDGHAVSQYTGAMPKELLVGVIDRQLGSAAPAQ
jgi:thioredoxin 1